MKANRETWNLTLVASLATLAAGLPMSRSPADARVQPERLVFHDIPSLPFTELQPGIQIKPIVGQAGTFVYAEFDPGARTAPHHHTHEQANFGLGGSNEISIGGRSYPLAKSSGTLAPADAEHFIVNSGSNRAALLEFQPVRRLDLLPPRPAPTYSSAAEAASVPEDAKVSLDFQYATSGWENVSRGVRRKVLPGKACTLVVWDVVGSDATNTDLGTRTTHAERFAYVAAGNVEIMVGGEKRKIGPGTLIQIPRTLAHLPIHVIWHEHAVIAGFDPVPSP